MNEQINFIFRGWWIRLSTFMFETRVPPEIQSRWHCSRCVKTFDCFKIITDVSWFLIQNPVIRKGWHQEWTTSHQTTSLFYNLRYTIYILYQKTQTRARTTSPKPATDKHSVSTLHSFQPTEKKSITIHQNALKDFSLTGAHQNINLYPTKTILSKYRWEHFPHSFPLWQSSNKSVDPSSKCFRTSRRILALNALERISPH